MSKTTTIPRTGQRDPWELIKLAGVAVGTAGAVISVIWAIGEPMAGDWVDKVLKEKQYAQAKSVSRVEKQVNKNADVAKKVQEQSTRIEERQKIMMELLREQRQTNQMILQRLPRQ